MSIQHLQGPAHCKERNWVLPDKKDTGSGRCRDRNGQILSVRQVNETFAWAERAKRHHTLLLWLETTCHVQALVSHYSEA